MWHKDDPLPMSIDQWRERERKRERRSLIIIGLMALAFSAGLIYVFGGGA